MAKKSTRDLASSAPSVDTGTQDATFYTALLGNLPGMAYRMLNQPDWPAEFISEGSLALTGYAPSALLAGGERAYGDLIHPDDRERVWAEVQAALDAHQSFKLTYRIHTVEGTLKWVFEQGAGIYDEDGNLLSLAGFITDITERQAAEAEVQKRAAELQTVAEVGTAASTILDPDQLLARVVELTKANFDLYHAHIYLIDEAGESLVLAAGAGEAGKQMLAQGWQIAADSETSLVARAFRTREGVTINDVREAPDFLPNPLLPDTRAELAVPLIVGEQVLGVLDVQSDQVDRFTREDIAIQTTLAGQIASAIQNARLFEAQMQTDALIRQRAEFDRLVTEVSSAFVNVTSTQIDAEIDRALEQIGKFSNVDRSYVFIFSDDGTHMTNTHEWCAPGIAPQIQDLQNTPVTALPWFTERITRPDQVIYLSRVADLPAEAAAEKQIFEEGAIRSLLAVPMIFAGSVAGFMGFDSVRQEREWGDEEINTLKSVGQTMISTLQRRRAEAAILEERNFSAAIINSLPGIFYVVDAQANLLRWNDRYLAVVGYTPDELASIGGALGPIADEDKGAVAERIQQVFIEGEAEVEAHVITKSGERIPYYLSGKRAEIEGNSYVVGMGIDTTAQKQAQAALQENEERLGLALEAAEAAVWEFLPLAGEAYFDDRWYTMLGYAPQELPQSYDTWRSLLHPDDLAESEPIILETIQRGGDFSREFRMKTKDGGWRWIQAIGKTVGTNEDGVTNRMLGTHTDVTERVISEAEIQKRATELQTVAEVGTAASTILEPDQLLAQVVELTKTNFDLYHAHIYLIDESGDNLVLAAGAGEAGKQMKAQGWQIAAASATSLVARAFRTREGVTVNDVREAPDFLPNPLLPDTRAELAVPLLVGERVLGVLDVQSARVGRFTDEDIAIQTTLAGQIASALQNAQFVDQVEHNLRETEVRLAVSQALAEAESEEHVWTALLAQSGLYPEAAVGLYAFEEEEGKKIQVTRAFSHFDTTIAEEPVGTRFPADEFEVTAIVAGGEQIITNDIFADERMGAGMREDARKLGYVSLAATPIMLGNTIIGLIVAHSPHEGYFDEAKLDLYATLAEQGAIALQAARLRDQLTANEERLGLALEAAEAAVWEFLPLAGEAYFDDRWYTMLGYAPQELPQSYDTWRSLLHPDDLAESEPIILETIQRGGDFSREFRMKTKDGGWRWIQAIGKTVSTNDDGVTTRMLGTHTDVTERIISEAEIQKRAAELQTVADVGTAASTILEPDQLLTQVVELTKTNFDLYHAHIYLIDESGDNLVLAAGAGEAGKQMLAQGWQIAADSETSLVARAFRTREGITVNDVREAPDFLPNPLLPDTRAELAVPLIVGERVLGVLDVQSARVGRFTAEDIAIQTTLAGQIAAAIENARIVSDIREREAAILEERNFSAAIINSLPGIFYVVDAQANLLRWNDRYLAVTGYTPDELTSIGALGPIADEDKESVAERIQQVFIEGEAEVEAHIATKSGERIPYYLTGKRTEIEGNSYIVGTGIDMTAQKQAQAALQENEERLGLALEAAEAAVWEFLPLAGEAYFDDRWYTMLGYAPQELPQSYDTWRSLLHPDDLAESEPIILETIQRGGDFTREFRMKTKDGGWRWIQAIGKTVGTNDDGVTTRMLGTHTDITERKRAEVERERFATQLSTAAEITQQVGAILDTDALLNTVIPLLKERFDLYHTHVYLVDETQHMLMLRAGYGTVGKIMAQQGHKIALDNPRSLVARAAREKDVVVSNDVTQDPNFMPNLLLPDTLAEVAVPFMMDERVLGVFDVQADAINAFSESDLDVFRTLAGQIANAFRSAQLFEQQKQAEIAQREAVERIRAIFEAMTEGITVTNTMGQIEDLNEATLRLHAFNTREDVLGRSAMELFARAHWSKASRSIRQALEAGRSETDEYKMLRQDGSIFDAEMNSALLRDPDGSPAGFVSITRDISTRKQAELELQRFATQLNTAAGVASQVNSILDPQELLAEVVPLIKERFDLYHVHVYTVDPKAQTLVMRVGAGEAGRKMLEQEHTVPLNQTHNLVARAAQQREAIVVNDVTQEPGYKPNPLLPDTRAEMAVPLIAVDQVLGVIDVHADAVNRFTRADLDVFTTLAAQLSTAFQNAQFFAEIQKAAEQLREMDRLKSEFLANMSHELRTPLNSIIGYTQLLLMDLEGAIPEECYTDMQSIDTNSKHLLNLINDILDLAKIEAGRLELHMEELDVATLLETVKSNNTGLFIDSDLAFSVEVEPDLPKIYADPLRITQVLNNLISNAFKFTETGSITVRAYRQDNEVCIAIQDTGIGIAEKDLDAVFERFRQVDGSFTRRAEGTGLGLSITQLLVEKHNGHLEVQSKLGEGSTFIVHLPVVE